jgi:hypothetical protein
MTVIGTRKRLGVGPSKNKPSTDIATMSVTFEGLPPTMCPELNIGWLGFSLSPVASILGGAEGLSCEAVELGVWCDRGLGDACCSSCCCDVCLGENDCIGEFPMVTRADIGPRGLLAD